MHNCLKMVFFLLSRDHKEISSLRRAFRFSCCDLLSLDEPKNWEDQNMKIGKADSLSLEILKQNQPASLKHRFVFNNCGSLILAVDHVIFKVSWSIQPIFGNEWSNRSGECYLFQKFVFRFHLLPSQYFAVQMTYLTPFPSPVINP